MSVIKSAESVIFFPAASLYFVPTERFFTPLTLAFKVKLIAVCELSPFVPVVALGPVPGAFVFPGAGVWLGDALEVVVSLGAGV